MVILSTVELPCGHDFSLHRAPRSRFQRRLGCVRGPLLLGVMDEDDRLVLS